MIYVETLGKIRRRYFVNGETISQIARDFRLTRKTVRKLIKSTDPAPKYVRQHQPQPKLGAFQTVLEDWLKTDSQRPRRNAARLSGCMKAFNARVIPAPMTACSGS